MMDAFSQTLGGCSGTKADSVHYPVKWTHRENATEYEPLANASSSFSPIPRKETVFSASRFPASLILTPKISFRAFQGGKPGAFSPIFPWLTRFDP
jgi:hypothetical protein